MTEMVLVPREPTEAMMEAGRDAAQDAFAHAATFPEEAASVWRCMIAAAPSSPVAGWQPIETAPKDGTAVLLTGAGEHDSLAYGDCPVCIGMWGGGKWRDQWDDFYGPYDPTHWMPLPQPPALLSTGGAK